MRDCGMLTAKSYKPQLDALRALAVIGVLFAHFWVPMSNSGVMGVRLFFVLSGFLITALLLERPTLLDFYGRRAFRLLPAFLLAIAFSLALDLPEMRATWKWHLLGLTNVRLFLRQSWDGPWPADHLWSLDVEWQFYFVWPLIVLSVPRRILPYVFAATFAGGPLYRFFETNDAMGTLPFASIDALSAGTLLALYVGPSSAVYILGIVAAPLTLWDFHNPNELTAVGSVATLAALVLAGQNGVLKWFELQPLVQLGKISYGVYLYHLFIWAALLPLGRMERGFFSFFSVSALTMTVAWLSYTYFEVPMRVIGRRCFPVARAPAI